ncbi:MAG: SiaB family protein kinase [Campylobacterota bacterium]|nr:SiaB family protein kinase [Campylobacterota bacterium]
MNISDIQNLVDNDGIIFISYGGILTQSLISSMTEALELEADKNNVGIGVSSNIFTVFIELSQNMMNYSKSNIDGCRDIVPGGLIIVSKSEDKQTYFIDSQNIISIDDKIKIEPKLEEVTTLNRDELKKRYKELRRSGRDTHEKGGGIGFYEIAKRCNSITYEFIKINEDKYYFHIRTQINIKKD